MIQTPPSPPKTLGSKVCSDSSAIVARIGLLTGGGDKPYALGLASALAAQGTEMDFIGSDELCSPELLAHPAVNFLNLRGDQRPNASIFRKVRRLLVYYVRLIVYAMSASPKIFHILWNNKVEFFDRTLLMLFYKLLGKKIAFTVHNVNIGQRDSNDTWLNRASLKMQYLLCDHLFVHTDVMKGELISSFGIQKEKITVIPFGINNTVPNTVLSVAEAKRQLGIDHGDKTLLFFGNIAPYKGLEYLVGAFSHLAKTDNDYRLIIAGRPKGAENYWKQIEEALIKSGVRDRVIERIEYVPDEQTELYFKAADVLVLPYTRIFQSGVLFLGYSFGLPVLAADVGSLKEEIIEDKTGFVFKAQDSLDLARMVERYFASDLFKNLSRRREEIKLYANERYSWDKVAAITTSVYSKLLQR